MANLERTNTEILSSQESPSSLKRLVSSSGLNRLLIIILIVGYFADNEASFSSLGSSVGMARTLTTSMATIEYNSDDEKEEVYTSEHSSLNLQELAEEKRPLKRKRGEQGMSNINYNKG